MPNFENQSRKSRRNQKPENQILSIFLIQMPKFKNQSQKSRRNLKLENQIISTFHFNVRKNTQFQKPKSKITYKSKTRKSNSKYFFDEKCPISKDQSQKSRRNQKVENQILSTFSNKNAQIQKTKVENHVEIKNYKVKF
jgi:hypothetical protein